MASETCVTGSWLFMVLFLLFLIAELVISFLCNSLMNLVDCFNTLSRCFLLVLPVVTKFATQHPSQSAFSFGWGRLGPLMSLISSVLLTSLCFTVALSIIHRFLYPHPIEKPLLATTSGIMGIIINSAAMILSKDRANGLVEETETKDSFLTLNTTVSTFVNEAALVNNGCIRTKQLEDQSVNTSNETAKCQLRSSTFLKSSCIISKSIISSCLVLLNGLVYYFLESKCYSSKTYPFCLYLDPSLSAIVVTILVTTSVPFIKKSGLLLLQSVPCHIDIQKLKQRISVLPGVIDTHDLHVWQLSSNFTVATVHIKCAEPSDYKHLADKIKTILHSEEIYSATIQPEFIQHAGESCGMDFCELACRKECDKNLCCIRRDAKDGPVSTSETDLKEMSKEDVIINAYV
ncbi:zinc transporter 1-like isoform X2 [Protopterus annectens]|uniref:zinc transporter 1-like isoform X2 n=1 Tax=Protopterus annectens TaxID=7888 RepID=UPI001CFB9F07|nr:zinc transporter 1-like isoform X2 [Protopterus annectens]